MIQMNINYLYKIAKYKTNSTIQNFLYSHSYNNKCIKDDIYIQTIVQPIGHQVLQLHLLKTDQGYAINIFERYILSNVFTRFIITIFVYYLLIICL